MKKTTTINLFDKRNNLVGIQVNPSREDKFIIPVADVRVSEGMRRKAEAILKASRVHMGSKFMRPTYSLVGRSYQVSQKH